MPVPWGEPPEAQDTALGSFAFCNPNLPFATLAELQTWVHNQAIPAVASNARWHGTPQARYVTMGRNVQPLCVANIPLLHDKLSVNMLLGSMLPLPKIRQLSSRRTLGDLSVLPSSSVNRQPIPAHCHKTTKRHMHPG